MIWKTWEEHLWGTYAALLERTPENLWCTTTYNAQEQYHGEPLLPVGVSAHSDCAKRFVNYWISRDGWILLDIREGVFPVAESTTCFFEREALRRALVHNRPRAILRWREIPMGTAEDFARFEDRNSGPDEDDSEPDDDSDVDFEPRYLSDPQRLLDQQLAEALGLPLYQPACDSCMHIWYDGSRLVFPYEFWETANRVLHGNSTEDVACMIVAAASVCPTIGVIWEGPLGEAPRPGEEVAARVASICRNEQWRGHLLVIGRPANYRVHEQLFEKPLYIARVWEARREEWEATRNNAREGSNKDERR
jgi:hypothetical protein